MTHADDIVEAVKVLVAAKPDAVFTRDQVRRTLGLSREERMSGYTGIFQRMRVDEPGAAPRVAEAYSGILRRVERGKYTLTAKGRALCCIGIPDPRHLLYRRLQVLGGQTT